MKQIFPPDITGKSFAEGGSVLDHNFGRGEPYTLGVEEEYMLLDGDTLDLVQHVETVLAATAGHELEASVNPELMQSVLEIATPVCRTAADVDAELRKLRAYVTGLAREQGMRVGSAGTHPFSLFERQRITARDRYHHLVDQLQYVARRELIFGLHIHVAVDEAEKAVQIVNGLLAHLSQLLALSASSPFIEGVDSGLHSARTEIFTRMFPRCGVPDAYDGWSGFERYVRFLYNTGSIDEHTQIWWSVRPHLAFPTVEIRICDAEPDLAEAQSLAALIYTLTVRLARAHDEGEPIELLPHRLNEENLWRAIRYGLSGELIELTSGDVRPARAHLEALIEWVLPVAEELGTAHLLTIPSANAAERQRARYEQGATIQEIYAEQVAAGEPVRG